MGEDQLYELYNQPQAGDRVMRERMPADGRVTHHFYSPLGRVQVRGGGICVI